LRKINGAPRPVERCTLRFHEIDDLEIALAAGVIVVVMINKETSKRFGGSVGQTNIALHG
jgi:hypothetical protein